MKILRKNIEALKKFWRLFYFYDILKSELAWKYFAKAKELDYNDN